MADMYKSVIPPHMGEKNPSKNILKLGRKITDVAYHMAGITSNAPEYWGLAEILTDEEAEFANHLKLRTHYTFDEVCQRVGAKTEAERKAAQEMLDKLCYVGLMEFDYGDFYDHNGRYAPQGERRYTLSLFVPGSAEMFNMEELPDGSNPRLEEHPAVASMFERMTYLPLARITPSIPQGGAGVGMHVIPVEKAISMENQTSDLEHLSYWLKKYEDRLGVGRCSCRASRGALGEGCADDDYSWCIGIGDFADYCRETGKGHDITYDEAMAILKNAEDNGFVHQITNIDGDNHIFGICNCNVKICNALRTSLLFNTPNLSRSAYTAKVEEKDCVACGKCVEYCPAGAVKLGQKLCTKDGPVVYPRAELPDNKFWSAKEHWDEDYRDTTRINCYDTGTAPCKAACPAHVAVQGYLKMAAQGRYQDALALIKKDNPFPAICGRVCNHRCEEACTRGTIDQPVAIDPVKKFIAEQDLNAETRYVPPVVIASNRYEHWDNKIAIIGAGPAGLSCAYYLATIGHQPVVFEKSEKPGGMMRYGIPSYKLEKDIIDAEIDVLKELGVEFRCGVEVGKDVTIQQLKDEGFEAFYIAIGCQGGRLPGVPGEDAKGLSIAVDFLHSATENQAQTMNGNVIVIGGGNVAVDCARTAQRFGADKVSMVCLESRDTMPASNEEVSETLEEGIDICNSWGPKEILKDEDGNVKAVVFKKCTQTIDPKTGKFSPLYDEDDTMTIEANAVVFAIGQAVEWGEMLEGTGVTFHHGNYPVADALTYQTADPCIFVGGDVYSGPKFVIDAIEAGKCAADSLHRYVRPNADMTIGKNRRDFHELDKDYIVVNDYDHAGRQEAGMDESIDAKKSFRDAHKTLTEEQVKIETARCLGCGASVVDPNKCLGCGVCTTKCEFDAIKLHRDHPDCTRMRKAEEKFNYIIPYALKRTARIITKYEDPAEKAYQEKYEAFRAKYENRNK